MRWIFLCVVCILVVYMLIRNELVFRYRTRILDDASGNLADCRCRYHNLPSYRRMFWQLFRFNWDDYLDEDGP